MLNFIKGIYSNRGGKRDHIPDEKRGEIIVNPGKRAVFAEEEGLRAGSRCNKIDGIMERSKGYIIIDV